MSQWGERTSAQKGALGEQIVDRYLVEQGYIPYGSLIDGAHPFDRLCASRDKREVFIADVKSKACRLFYPDTGIGLRHYQEY